MRPENAYFETESNTGSWVGMADRFAADYLIAPGILVGRMQKSGLLPWTHLNSLKVKLELPDPN